jgi:ketosteroid isomerase-like protein
MRLAHLTVAVGVFISAASLAAQSPQGSGTSERKLPAAVISPSDQSAAGNEVLTLERDIAAAIVRGDAAYFDRVTTPDFVMIHGDGWTNGGRPALVDDKASFMRRVANKSYAAHDYDVQSVEMHGDVAITYGRYVGNIPSSPAGRQWFSVWYQKVYAKRDGRWLYLSHRTVDGAHYGDDRRSVSAD